jgi:hypothetical protein
MPLKLVCGACGEIFAKRERRVWVGVLPYHRKCKDKTTSINNTHAKTVELRKVRPSRSGLPPEASNQKIVKAFDQNVLSAVIKTLQRCGEGHVLAQIVYKKPGEDWVTERRVEPYQFTYSVGGTIVECWQINPDLGAPAWRNFRVDRIVRADATAVSFAPRIPVTLHTGETRRFVMEENKVALPSAATPVQLYTERLNAVLADLDLTDVERLDLSKLAQNLEVDQIRAIHGRFYAMALAEICADGHVRDEEIERLTAIRIWLTELGWSP